MNRKQREAKRLKENQRRKVGLMEKKIHLHIAQGFDDYQTICQATILTGWHQTVLCNPQADKHLGQHLNEPRNLTGLGDSNDTSRSLEYPNRSAQLLEHSGKLVDALRERAPAKLAVIDNLQVTFGEPQVMPADSAMHHHVANKHCHEVAEEAKRWIDAMNKAEPIESSAVDIDQEVKRICRSMMADPSDGDTHLMGYPEVPESDDWEVNFQRKLTAKLAYSIGLSIDAARTYVEENWSSIRNNLTGS